MFKNGQKAISRAVALAVFVCSLVFMSSTASASVDDYPAQWRNVPQDSVLDSWREYNRECTSFVAFRLSSRIGFQMPFHDNAVNWKSRAMALGYAVNSTPTAGSVAYFSYGHVAWVESVSPNGQTVRLEEYNNPAGSGAYHVRDVAVGAVTGYIHFRDTNPGSPITATRQADGRLAVFYVGGDHAIYYQSQVSPGGGWGSERRIPAYAKAITSVTSWDGRIELFYIGGDDSVFHRWQPWANSEVWSPEENFGTRVKAISAARNGAGKIAITTLDFGGHIVYRQQSSPDSWAGTGWQNFIGVGTDITMSTSADGRNEMFYIGGTSGVGPLMHRWELSPGGEWSPEEGFWGQITKLAASRNQDGRLEVFVVGDNNRISTKWQTQPNVWYGSWSGLTGLGRYLTATRSHDGRLELFHVGGNNRIYHQWQQGQGCCWSGEVLMSGIIAG